MKESDWWRFPLGTAALLEFIATGYRDKITIWRYCCFFVLPILYLLGMLWLSKAQIPIAIALDHSRIVGRRMSLICGRRCPAARLGREARATLIHALGRRSRSQLLVI
jgi:hypothetical protein